MRERSLNAEQQQPVTGEDNKCNQVRQAIWEHAAGVGGEGGEQREENKTRRQYLDEIREWKESVMQAVVWDVAEASEVFLKKNKEQEHFWTISQDISSICFTSQRKVAPWEKKAQSEVRGSRIAMC